MPAGRDAGRILGWLAGYVGLIVWLTWPLAARLTHTLPCPDPAVSFDTVYSAWVVSWLSHALTTAPWHAGNANIYYPDAQALYYGPAGFGAVPYALPAFLATGNAALAVNVAFLSCVALTAVALHWVVWRWTGSAAAGFVAAWTLLMNRWFLWGFVASTPHLAAIQYLPLIVFLAAEPLRTRRATFVLLALVAVQCLTDPVYIAPAVLAPLGVLATARIVRRAWRPSGWRLLGVIAAVPLCLAPFLIGYVQVRLHNPALAKQSLWQLASINTIKGVMPTNLPTVFWRTLTPRTPPPVLVGLAVIGLIAAGGLAGVLRRWWGAGSGLGRYWAAATLWVVVGTFVSLTPVTMVDFPRLDGTWTSTRIHLPQYLLAMHTPLYQVVRVPARLGVSAMIGICLLTGLATAELSRALAAIRVRRLSGSFARVGLAVAIAALAHRIPPLPLPALPRTYPLQDAPPTDPELLRQLRATDGPVLEMPILQLPTGDPRLSFVAAQPNAVAMYRSTLHWRPLVNGYSSYWPAGYVERLLPTNDLPAPLALEHLVCDTGVRTIIVNLAGLTAERRAAWLHTITTPAPGLELIGRYPTQLLFTVTVPLPGEPGGPACPPPAGEGDPPGISPPAPAPPRDGPGSARSDGARSRDRVLRRRAGSDARRACPSGFAARKRCMRSSQSAPISRASTRSLAMPRRYATRLASEAIARRGSRCVGTMRASGYSASSASSVH